MPPGNGWNEWSKYVLKELERLNECFEKLDKKMDRVNSRLTMLQIKVGGIGATVSIVVTVIILVIYGFMKK